MNGAFSEACRRACVACRRPRCTGVGSRQFRAAACAQERAEVGGHDGHAVASLRTGVINVRKASAVLLSSEAVLLAIISPTKVRRAVPFTSSPLVLRSSSELVVLQTSEHRRGAGLASEGPLITFPVVDMQRVRTVRARASYARPFRGINGRLPLRGSPQLFHGALHPPLNAAP